MWLCTHASRYVSTRGVWQTVFSVILTIAPPLAFPWHEFELGTRRRGITVKVYITGHKDPTAIKLFDSDLDPSEWEDGSAEDLNPGSDSLVMIKPDNLWFNENKFGVVLKAKMIVVKRGIGRRSYGLEDMIL